MFKLVSFVFLLLLSCSRDRDRLLDAVGYKPDHNEVLRQGSDTVRNILFLKDNYDDKDLYSEIMANLKKSKILDGGHEDKEFYSGELFLLNSLGYNSNSIERRCAFVFSQEDSAIILYDAPDWVLIETVTW